MAVWNAQANEIFLKAVELGLAGAIDGRLHLLKYHLPYHESDHVLNFAYNALCNGTCLDDIELRRNDLVFLDAIGADRIPDPTTAGDFCRRFTTDDARCARVGGRRSSVRARRLGQLPGAGAGFSFPFHGPRGGARGPGGR